MAHRPQLTAVDDLAHARGERVVAPVERLGDDEPGAGSGVGHARRLLLVRGEGLLAQHVLAGVERAQRPLAVQAVRERVVDRFDLGIGEKRAVAGVHPGNSVLLGELPGALRVAGGHRHDLRLGELTRRAHQRRRRDGRGAEGPDAKRFRHGPCLPRMRPA